MTIRVTRSKKIETIISSEINELVNLLISITASLTKKIGNKKFNRKAIILFNGKNVGKDIKDDSKCYYKFEIPEKERISTEDEIKYYVQGNSITAEITSIDNQFIIIKINGSYGETLTELKLEIESTKILVRLNEKIINLLNDSKINSNKYPLLNNLIKPVKNEVYSQWTKTIIYEEEFNDKQKIATYIALNNKISFIWGPPGTGKTKTLGTIAYNLIKNKKRVLFTSNTNRAVDNGLLAVIKQYTNRGEEFAEDITRYGQTALIGSKELSQIQFDNQIEDLRNKESDKIQKLKTLVEQYQVVMPQLDKIKNHENKINKKNIDIDQKKRELQITANKISEINIQLNEIKNGGFVTSFKMFFGSLSEEKIKEAKNRYKEAGKTLKDNIELINQQILVIKEQYEPLMQRKTKFEDIVTKVKEFGGINKIQEKIKSLLKIDEKAFLLGKMLVGSTLAKIVMNEIFWSSQFDVLLIDEASMVDLAYLTTLSTLIKDKIIIIGDPQQLAPIAEQDDILRKDIFMHASNAETISELFLWNENNPAFIVFLDTQYRMTGKLGNIISETFYENKLKNGLKNKNNIGNIVLLDTRTLKPVTLKYESEKGKNSFLPYNPVHAKQIILAVKNSIGTNSVTASEIGVIVPFNASVQYLRQEFKKNNLENIEIGTVHTFQGREKNVIIFDTVMAGVNFTVRSFDETKSNVNEIARLLNVALSRAKVDIYVIADMNHFDQFYKDQLVHRVLTKINSASSTLDIETIDKNYSDRSLEEIDKLLNE